MAIVLATGGRSTATLPYTLRRRLSAWLVGLALIGTACGGSDAPMLPSTASTLAGRWSGDLVLEAIRTRMTWTLTEDAQRVNGEALVLLPSGTVLLNGMLVGTLNGTMLDYTITVVPGGIPALPACAGQFGGTATVEGTPASSLNGHFSLISSVCAPPVTNGTFTLTRQ